MNNTIDDTSSKYWIDLTDGSAPMELDTTLMTGVTPEYLWDHRVELHLAFKEGERVMANELADPELRYVVVERFKNAVRAIHDNAEEILPFAAAASEDGERLILNLNILWAELDAETQRDREVLSMNMEVAREKSEEFVTVLAEGLNDDEEEENLY